MAYSQISPEDFLDLWSDSDRRGKPMVIDVREPEEWDYYHLPETNLIPMREIPYKTESLPGDRPLYIICAHGVRSRRVCTYLAECGFENLVNVNGGMAAVAELKGFAYD